MRMTALEALFARAEQGRIFLLLLPGGMALGALFTLGGRLRRYGRVLSWAADALCALLAAALMWAAAFLGGDGLRLYALLGLLLGAALWRAGIQPLLDALAGLISRAMRLFAGTGRK